MLDILFDSGEHGIEKESMKRSIGAKLLTLCNKNGDIRKNRARLEWSYRKSLLRMASQLFEFNDVKSLISSIYMDQSGFFYRVESDTLKRKNNEPVWDVHYVRDEVGEIVDAIEYRRVD